MLKLVYLSYEEQFKEILNNEEISRIYIPEIRKIREKYWELQREAFLNEQDIPDKELGNVSEKLRHREQKELQRFKNNISVE